MIHHLSFRCGGSVNNFIPSKLCSAHYASVDDAVKMIMKLGPNCHLAKTDVRTVLSFLFFSFFFPLIVFFIDFPYELKLNYKLQMLKLYRQ